jgi:predicted transcriptional regulator
MSRIKKYDDFLNEGKITQLVFKVLLKTSSYIQSVINRMKGKHTPFEFKDKKMERLFMNKTIELFDYSVFDSVKYHFTKKQKEVANKTSLSDLIKTRTGIDVYQLADSILDILKIENIKVPDGKEEETNELLKGSIELIKKMTSFVKNIDDEIEDDRQFRRDLAELGELFKGLDPRTMHLRDKDDTLAAFDKVGSKLDDMQEPKELDYILDKISKFGMSSLTSKEKDDLEKLSK